MTEKELYSLLEKLVKQPKESEWVEFKLNYHSDEEIGKCLSAISNGACLHNQPYGYLIFGIKDTTQTVEGTTFRAKSAKRGNEELENWLAQRLNPRVDFNIYEFDYTERHISLYVISAAHNQPVSFMSQPYVRVGSITRNLGDFPEKARKIWKKEPEKPFENEIAIDGIDADEVVKLLDTQCYFDLIKLPYPTTREAVLEKFKSEKLIIQNDAKYAITNLGGLLFAKNLNDIFVLSRKAVRVIVYKGKNKIETLKDTTGMKGYALGFEGLVNFINDQLPTNEEIKRAFRETVRMYPELAVRELVANAIIHQEFREKGTGPMVEIYTDRIEISNPGLPIITPIRFIDEYQSRNEILAGIMRRLRICEEKGSGIDKVVFLSEVYQLPAPDFIAQEKHTKAIMYAYQKLNDMDKKDKIRACYQHCCLKYVSNEKMTNQTLRERFQIEEQNAAIASRIIKDTLDAKLIRLDDPESTSKKFVKYIPFWA